MGPVLMVLALWAGVGGDAAIGSAAGAAAAVAARSMAAWQTLGACCFVNGDCELLTESECLERDAYSWREGESCEEACPEAGACCLDDACAYLIGPYCEDIGGSFTGPGSDCLVGPCSGQPLGVCCFPDGACAITTRDFCESYEGIWIQSSDCEEDCNFAGACCLEDGSCRFLFESDCGAEGGIFQGEDTECEPEMCTPVPVQTETWGAIKATYR